MIELPEAITLGLQLNAALAGKTIVDVVNANSVHKFTFFYADPLTYGKLLIGKKVLATQGYGIFVDIMLEDDIRISFNDGINLYYGSEQTNFPAKYQLGLKFSDGNFLVFSVAMYGAIAAYQGEFDNPYHHKSVNSISPLSSGFSQDYFKQLIAQVTKNISLKALLATEQRIPGIGNGVVQDILFNASLHPKKKIQSLTDQQQQDLFLSIKSTLQTMTEQGGRDTENDLYGRKGGYKTLMSKNGYKHPCPKCSGNIYKENFMGGTIYYCPNCQQL